MWDLRLDPETRDLTAGYAHGRHEVLQRLVTRLNRDLGEWFLDTTVGIPWYPHYPGRKYSGRGILGSRDKRAMELLIRNETLGTAGVSRIIKLNSLFDSAAREVRIYMQVALDDGFISALSLDGFTERGVQWNMA